MNNQIEELKVEFLEKTEQLRHDLKKSYRSVRRSVREHPEKGLLIAMAGGLILGYFVSKAISSNKK